MKNILSQLPLWYYICLGFCILLAIVAFFIPPVGVIDNSVLVAIGEIGSFGLIGIIPNLLSTNKSLKVTKGNTSIEVKSDKEA